MKWILVLLAATAGCGGSSSYLAEYPEDQRVGSPGRVRSPGHSAALADALLEANGQGQAGIIADVCDLGYAVGNADGYQTGIEWSDHAVEVHCLGAITREMMIGYLADVGGDQAAAMEKVKKRCEGPQAPPAVSKYGESLLQVTQSCRGNQTCALTLQTAFRNCYVAGMKETVGDEPDKALGRMLNTCGLFNAVQPACQKDAYTSVDSLRRRVREFRAIRPRQ